MSQPFVTAEMRAYLREALGEDYPLDSGMWQAFSAGRRYERTESSPDAGSVAIEDDQIVLSAQEFVRAACASICDDVDAISRRDGELGVAEKRYEVGVANACAEIRHRINALDFHVMREASARAGIAAKT